MKLKQTLTIDLERIDLEYTLDDLIINFTKLKNKYSEYTNLRIVEEPSYDGNGYYYYFKGDILETDEQEAARELYEKSNIERNLAYERTQYERLKAKFEKN